MRILLVEDEEWDAKLTRDALERAGLAVDMRRVQNEPELRRALEEFHPDLVLSDFTMPRFSGIDALAVCRELRADLPFIFLSGTIGEEVAVRAMKAGASDYITKGNLVRLAPAIERELREAKARRGLRLAEVMLYRAHAMAKLGYVVTGVDGAFETWSESLPGLIGVKPEHMPKTTREWLALLHPEDRPLFRDTSIRAAETGAHATIDYRIVQADGGAIHVRQVIEPLLHRADAAGRWRWVSTIQDITAQAQAEQKIKRLNRVHAVLSAINGLIVRVRVRDELFREACRIAVEEGQFPVAWLAMVDGTGSVSPVAWSGAFDGAVHAAGGESGPLAQALREKRPVVASDVALLPLIVAGDAVGMLGLHAAEAGFFDEQEMKLLRELAGDISFAIEHIGNEEKLNYLAYYDAITGLANRTLFFERLAQALRAGSNGERKGALIIGDVERFKAINDSLGRQAGDELLRQIAGRLRVAWDGALIGRVGADQFAIVVPELRNENELARMIEQKARALFAQPYRAGEAEVHVSARAGIALFPGDGEDAETLFRNAESALKRAKETGARQLFYRQEMSARTAEMLSLETRLRRALENDEFILHYQPKVDAESRRICGVEALMRWQSPELGLVPPLRFIRLMEETGLILEAGAWALAQAVRDQGKWRDAGLAVPRVAVNLSAIQLQQRNFFAVIERALRHAGVPPAVDLEITESLLMQDIEGNIAKLRQARELGLQIAIDDFGTGHSSLSYLAKLPVDALKIDRSFVITMLSEPDTMTLVQTMISLAHSLRLKVIAEGVDAEDQAKVLRLLRCDEIQGYLISKPVPAAQFAALLG